MFYLFLSVFFSKEIPNFDKSLKVLDERAPAKERANFQTIRNINNKKIREFQGYNIYSKKVVSLNSSGVSLSPYFLA